MVEAFLLVGIALCVTIVAGGWLYQQLGVVQDKRRFPPPGRIFRTSNGKRLHVQRSGLADGTVVCLEAGIAASSVSWVLLAKQLAPDALVISYDRAGLGWSKAASTPITVQTMVADLQAILDGIEASDPVILVAHSFGAIPVWAFTHLYGGRVAGIVLVDPVSISFWAHSGKADQRRLALGVRLARRGAVLASIGMVRVALALLARGARRLPQLINRAGSRSGRAAVERLIGQVRKMPPESWPVIRAHWSNPQAFRAMAKHLACLPAVAKEVEGMPLPEQIPLTIISAETATADELSERERWISGRPSSRHLRTTGTSHWLQLDRPELIADAVREMLNRLPPELRQPRADEEQVRPPQRV